MKARLNRQLQGLVTCRPFIKWVGGKSRLLDELIARLPEKFGHYHEPFIGGAALFFAIQPQQATLSDINPELINTYSIVANDVNGLIKDLRRHKYEEEYFYRVRDVDRSSLYARWSKVKKASRFIYLNKTCFNGLYRENSSGKFNVPFGRYSDPRICDAVNLQACSTALKSAQLLNTGFETVLERARKGDFVYFDPPYVPVSATSNFTAYSKNEFGAEQQLKLLEVCQKLDRKGVKLMLSNSAAPLVYELYRDFKIDQVFAPRAINSKGDRRGKIAEVIVRNY